MPAPPSSRFPALLLAGFVAVWLASGLAPAYPQDWWLENALVLVAVPLLVATHRRLRFSDAACAALFVFLVLHEVGAHYTYSEVPLAQWAQLLPGLPDGWPAGRNHYDRAMHLLYGLLVTPAALELIDARAPTTRLWRWILSVAFVSSHSVLYELVEWGAAAVFGGDLGIAYLGAQGDAWDAQKDMLLALAGSAFTATVLSRRAAPAARRA